MNLYADTGLALVDVTYRLTRHRSAFPELARAEAAARQQLASEIMAMDAAEDIPGRHNLHEQAAVEVALRTYGDALADLVLGETPLGTPDRVDTERSGQDSPSVLTHVSNGNTTLQVRNGVERGTWGAASLSAMRLAGADRASLETRVHGHNAEFTKTQLHRIAESLLELAAEMPDPQD